MVRCPLHPTGVVVVVRVLFMTSVYNMEDKGNLNVDLVDEFISQGHEVDVMTPVERRHGTRLRIQSHGRLRIIEFPSLNFRGRVNLIEKGLATLILGYLYRYFLRAHLSDVKYDLAVYTTLPVTYAPVLRVLKRRWGTLCYLLHKDFFPQSAVDLGLMATGSPSYRLFRHIEKGLYSTSDAIGVMSPRNVEYLLDHNRGVNPRKVEVCPNSIRPVELSICNDMKDERPAVRAEYSIPQDRVVFLYGGNISRAQGIDFVIDVAKRFDECSDAHLLFIGSGNEFTRLRESVARSGVSNVQVLGHLSKDEFDRVAAACDVGLVFLDFRFTIANIPSRTLAHMNFSQPILAATDEFTDFGDIVTGEQLGLWSVSNNVDQFLENIKMLSASDSLRERLGENARRYLMERCDVRVSYRIIMNRLESSVRSFDPPVNQLLERQ